jgi:hypothetical protein
VPALGATALQHITPGAGAHTGPETVLLGTAAVIGLVGALHAALLEPPAGSTTVDDTWTPRTRHEAARKHSRQDYGRAPPSGNRTDIWRAP